MWCSKCRTELPNRANFCFNCGDRVNSRQQGNTAINHSMGQFLNLNKNVTSYNQEYESNINHSTNIQNQSTALGKNYTESELVDIIKDELLIEPFEMIERFYINDRSQKSKEKFNNAMKFYFTETREFEIPCLLYDDTSFGSAKNGFIITNKAIHWRNTFEKSRQIAFKKIYEIHSEKKSLFINNEKIDLTLSPEYCLEIECLVRRLIKIIS